MRRLFASLKPGGIFTGQLFGLRDEWNVRGVSHRNGVQTVFLSTEDARHLFDGFDMIEFVEREYDAHKEDGSLKHMHIYDIIARKQ